jgi:hypothetical protein
MIIDDNSARKIKFILMAGIATFFLCGSFSAEYNDHTGSPKKYFLCRDRKRDLVLLFDVMRKIADRDMKRTGRYFVCIRIEPSIRYRRNYFRKM